MFDPSDSPRSARGQSPVRERAPRLQLTVPVAFRRVADDDWSRGATLDISRSGVLFVPADSPVPEGDDVLLVVFLSRAVRPENAMPMRDLYCGGRVARTTETALGQPALAIQIEFEWAEKPPGPRWGAPND